MTVTTGMSMFGKTSLGVRAMVSGPIPRMSSARTTKVYGRWSATRTIHIDQASAPILTLAVGLFATGCHLLPCRRVGARAAGGLLGCADARHQSHRHHARPRPAVPR